MPIIDWPTAPAFRARALQFGAVLPRSAFASFFTGQVQRIGHLSDRLRCTVTLPPCDALAGQQREAWVITLASTGDWVRLQHLHRNEPAGTLRGLPTVAAAAAAGARNLSVQTTSGATLLPGDMLGAVGQLVMVGHPGALADGAGLAAVPLAVPLVVAASAGQAVTWQRPTGTFQLAGDPPMAMYGRGAWQAAMDLQFLQVA